ncbi:MAG: radical SAM protein, partial [Lachnospiraceae bacterium]|nr:radical SAM protein [Lachnospiraceae bacterium]
MRKCYYCDFLSAPEDIACIREYIFALVKEIEAFKPVAEEYQVQTLYFGGGTPSSIGTSFIEAVFEAIRRTFDLGSLREATIEVNPGTADLKKLESYRKIGFNRISIGIQSADDKELIMLGRMGLVIAFVFDM